MAKFSPPGVYTEETPHFVPSITECPSAIPAFLGFTEIISKSGKSLINNPFKINSLKEFEKYFGGASKKRIKSNIVFYLYHSVKLYFQNGGTSCFIVSLGDYNTEPNKTVFLSAIDRLDNLDASILLLFPDSVLLNDTDLGEVHEYALNNCSEHSNRFCLLDFKTHEEDSKYWECVKNFRQNLGTANLKYGAAYTPWLRVQSANPNYRYRKETIKIPPSGGVAGIICQTDYDRGVWKAPANLMLNSVWALSRQISASEQDLLNVDVVSGKSINAIREFPDKGILIWGARTLAGNDNEWRYINVVRFCLFVENNIKSSIQWIYSEPNEINLWMKLRMVIENYLYLCWRNGALTGIKPEQAFYVRCGLGHTMSQNDIDAGNLIIEIGISILRPSEFLILRMQYDMS